MRNAIFKILCLIFAFVSILFAQQLVFNSDVLTKEQLILFSNDGLSKTLKINSTLSNQPYLDTDCNVVYNPPSGWKYTPLKEIGALLIYATNPSYSPGFTLVAFKLSSQGEANKAAGDFPFGDMLWAFQHTATQVSYLYFIKDTTINNIRNTAALVKYDDTHDSIRVAFYDSNGIYLLGFLFVTSVQDYNLNASEYLKNWLNFSFNKLAGINHAIQTNQSKTIEINTKGNIVSINTNQFSEIKLTLLDIMGRRIKNIFEGNVSQSKCFNISPEKYSQQTYLLELKSNKETRIVKLNSNK